MKIESYVTQVGKILNYKELIGHYALDVPVMIVKENEEIATGLIRGINETHIVLDNGETYLISDFTIETAQE